MNYTANLLRIFAIYLLVFIVLGKLLFRYYVSKKICWEQVGRKSRVLYLYKKWFRILLTIQFVLGLLLIFVLSNSTWNFNKSESTEQINTKPSKSVNIEPEKSHDEIKAKKVKKQADKDQKDSLKEFDDFLKK